jgi:hypothetical protein
MAKRKDDDVQIDGFDDEETQPMARVTPVEQKAEPTRNMPTGGTGPEGRGLVLTDAAAGVRSPRNTDEVLPRCPRCTNDEVAVLCTVGSKQGPVRHHYCPNKCGFSVKQIAPQVTDAMRRVFEAQRTGPKSAVERP